MSHNAKLLDFFRSRQLSPEIIGHSQQMRPLAALMLGREANIQPPSEDTDKYIRRVARPGFQYLANAFHLSQSQKAGLWISMVSYINDCLAKTPQKFRSDYYPSEDRSIIFTAGARILVIPPDDDAQYRSQIRVGLFSYFETGAILFKINPSDADLNPIPAAKLDQTKLKTELEKMWKNETNELLDLSLRGEIVSSTDQITRTMKMADALLRYKATEMLPSIKGVHVIVAGADKNFVEATIWAQLGARVTVVQPNLEHITYLKAKLASFPNVDVVCLVDGKAPQGDIVVWTHPGLGKKTEKLKELMQYLDPVRKPLLVIQSDTPGLYIDPFLSTPLRDPSSGSAIAATAKVILYREELSLSDYLLPSSFLACSANSYCYPPDDRRSSLIIAQIG